MSLHEAEQRLATLQRWGPDDWWLREIAARMYWRSRGGPDDILYAAARRSIEQAVAHGDPDARDSRRFVEQLAEQIEQASKDAWERMTGRPILPGFLETWVPSARQAVLYALTAEAASSWIARADREALQAANDCQHGTGEAEAIPATSQALGSHHARAVGGSADDNSDDNF